MAFWTLQIPSCVCVSVFLFHAIILMSSVCIMLLVYCLPRLSPASSCQRPIDRAPPLLCNRFVSTALCHRKRLSGVRTTAFLGGNSIVPCRFCRRGVLYLLFFNPFSFLLKKHLLYDKLLFILSHKLMFLLFCKFFLYCLQFAKNFYSFCMIHISISSLSFKLYFSLKLTFDTISKIFKG